MAEHSQLNPAILRAILRHHLFLYEGHREVYRHHESVPLTEATRRVDDLRRSVTRALTVADVRPPIVPDLAILLLSETQGDHSLNGPAVLASASGDRTAEAELIEDGWVGLVSRLRRSEPRTKVVIVGYCLHTYERNGEVVEAAKLEDLDQILDQPRWCGTAMDLNEAWGLFDTKPSSGSFYQRILFGFGGLTEKQASVLDAHADLLVATFVGTWGLELSFSLLGQETGYSAQARAWSHEVGQIMSAFDNDNVVAPEKLENYWACFPSQKVKSLGVLSQHLFESARAYLWLWASPKRRPFSVPESDDATAFFQAVFAIVRGGFFAERRARSLSATPQHAAEEFARFQERVDLLVAPDMRFSPGFPVDDRRHLARAMAAAMMNALQKIPWKTVKDKVHLILLVSPKRVRLINQTTSANIANWKAKQESSGREFGTKDVIATSLRRIATRSFAEPVLGSLDDDDEGRSQLPGTTDYNSIYFATDLFVDDGRPFLERT